MTLVPDTIEPLYDYLEGITLISVGETWRGFPTFLSKNKQVTISNNPLNVNFSSILIPQTLTVTLDPAGFFVTIVVNNNNGD